MDLQTRMDYQLWRAISLYKNYKTPMPMQWQGDHLICSLNGYQWAIFKRSTCTVVFWWEKVTDRSHIRAFLRSITGSQKVPLPVLFFKDIPNKTSKFVQYSNFPEEVQIAADVPLSLAGHLSDTYAALLSVPSSQVSVPSAMNATAPPVVKNNTSLKSMGMIKLSVTYQEHKPTESSSGAEEDVSYKNIKAASAKKWGLWTKHLTPLAADYYLLLRLSLEGITLKEFEAHRTKMTVLVAAYLDMAIGGELRHNRHTTDINLKGYLKNVPTKRGLAWGVWHQWRAEHPESLELAQKHFTAAGWGTAFGGKRWAYATKILRGWLEASLSAEQFLDQALALQHNGGIIFDKWFIDCPALKKVLDANLHNNVAGLFSYASEEVKDFWSLRGKKSSNWEKALAEFDQWFGQVPKVGVA